MRPEKIRIVFELGGDPAANETLARYINSRLWLQNQHQMAGLAVMALGMSRAPEARKTLLPLLEDATPLNAWIRMGQPFEHYRLDGTGRGSGIPMFVIAAASLQELGYPSVIPELEKAAAGHDPWFKPLFDSVAAALRAKRPEK